MAATKSFILPGDPLPALTDLLNQADESSSATKTKKKTLRLGAGLSLSPHNTTNPINPHRAGILTINPKKPAASISSVVRRYNPTISDPVLVTLVRTTAEAFMVQLTPYTPHATIPFTNFSTSGSTNATARKTRPNFPQGTLIYANVSLVHKHLEAPELSVPDGDNYGEVKGGYVFDVSARMVKLLLDEKGEGKVFLEALSTRTGFEMIVGRNGRVWIDAKEFEDVWKVARCFKEFDEGKMWAATEAQAMKAVVGELMKRIFGK